MQKIIDGIQDALIRSFEFEAHSTTADASMTIFREKEKVLGIQAN